MTAGRVLLAAPRGYCAGVERAIDAVAEAIRRYGPPVYVRKQIVHNTHVIAELSAAGAIFVDELDEVPDDALVVFSAHGIAPAVREQARARGLRTIDATCPLVTKVHKEARRFVDAGYDVVLVGHHGHEETDGTMGEAPGRIHLLDPTEEPDLPVGDKIAWLSQTTLAVDDTMAAVDRLRERFPQLADPPSDDICYASQNRQQAVKKIAPSSDLVLIVGSANSSNSARLVEVALAEGTPAAYLVDRVTDIDPEWLTGVTTVGLSSGASVPDVLVNDVLSWLSGKGYTDVHTITAATEHLTFSPPPELR